MNNLPRRDTERLSRVVPRPVADSTPAIPGLYSRMNRERSDVALGQLVRAERMRAGFTAAELGRLAGFAPSAVLNVEIGRGSRTTAHRLLALMGAGREIPAPERTAAPATQLRPPSTMSDGRASSAVRQRRSHAIVHMTPERLELLLEDSVAYAIASIAIAKASRRR